MNEVAIIITQSQIRNGYIPQQLMDKLRMITETSPTEEVVLIIKAVTPERVY